MCRKGTCLFLEARYLSPSQERSQEKKQLDPTADLISRPETSEPLISLIAPTSGLPPPSPSPLLLLVSNRARVKSTQLRFGASFASACFAAVTLCPFKRSRLGGAQNRKHRLLNGRHISQAALYLVVCERDFNLICPPAKNGSVKKFRFRLTYAISSIALH